MNDRARVRILERRARFLAAAAVVGLAVTDAACEAQACLDVVPPCETDAATGNVLEGPTKLCLGETAVFSYLYETCHGRTDGTTQASFTSSNPAVLALHTFRSFAAVGIGRATITANYNDGSGETVTLEVEVTACADAATDAVSDG